MEYRRERDTMGEIDVPQDALWGAQTERSRQNFNIGTEKMPVELIEALAILKKAAAEANFRLAARGRRRGLLCRSATRFLPGLNSHFRRGLATAAALRPT